jgi:hypothetical protein
MWVRRVSTAGFVFLAVIVAGAAFLAYSSYRGGPHLTAELHGNRWRIHGSFFGLHPLGFERVRIANATSSGVICEFVGHTNSDIDLVQGINTPIMMFGTDTKLASIPDSHACELRPGTAFELTVWGNNGFGHERPSSIQVRF